jgi:hypothetical protein
MIRTIPVDQSMPTEDRGADAEREGDRRGGGVVKVENERRHEQDHRERVVEHPVDDRRDVPAAHEVVEPRHRVPPLLKGVTRYAPVATDNVGSARPGSGNAIGRLGCQG